MSLAQCVRSQRKALDISQEALARRADVSLNVINRIERGAITDPHVTTLSAVAEALNTSVGELLGEGSDTPLAPAPPETERVEERRSLFDSPRDEWLPILNADETIAASYQQRFEETTRLIETWLKSWEGMMEREDFDAEQALTIALAAGGLFDMIRQQGTLDAASSVADAIEAGEELPRGLRQATIDLNNFIVASDGLLFIGKIARDRAKTKQRDIEQSATVTHIAAWLEQKNAEHAERLRRTG